MIMDPTGLWCAITDSLGRVVLFDVRRGCIVHLFKGYRDAHCVFQCVCIVVVVMTTGD